MEVIRVDKLKEWITKYTTTFYSNKDYLDDEYYIKKEKILSFIQANAQEIPVQGKSCDNCYYGSEEGIGNTLKANPMCYECGDNSNWLSIPKEQ